MTINLTPVADPGASVILRGRRADNEMLATLTELAGQYPAESPWYLVPGDTDDAQAKATRQIRAAAKALGRRIYTGTHATTHQPVWSLGGPALARKVREGKSTSISAPIADEKAQAPAKAPAKRSA